jgi:hypothetical protein
MLGADDTSVYFFDSPIVYTKGSPRTPRGDEWDVFLKKPEVGGVSVAVQRQAQETTFVALHEPFQHDKPVVDRFQRIAENDDGVAVRVLGEGINDRVLYAFGINDNRVIRLHDENESFAFVGHGFVRVGRKTVDVVGDIRSMSLKVSGTPQLILNGKAEKARVESGVLTYPE